ncbi:MAG: hypothetical protein KL787_07155 [Taibaiella sp.]|nr:hypothetical protein [Taibaiella sp.]
MLKKELVLMADQRQYEPEAQLDLNIGSVFGMKQPIYLFEGSPGKEEVRLVQPHTYKRSIQEGDRGGIQYQSFTVHNNRYFPLGAYIPVPWSNKELDIALGYPQG